MTSDLITPFISTFTFVWAGCSSPWSCRQRRWLLRGFITLQAICCPRWINLRNWLGSFRSKDRDSLSFLFAKACKVSTLSDDTIKLPTSGEMQKVGKWGSNSSPLMPACAEEFPVVIDGGNPERMIFLLESRPQNTRTEMWPFVSADYHAVGNCRFVTLHLYMCSRRRRLRHKVSSKCSQ